MKEIKLNNELSLFFEPLNKRVRLVVSENGEELVCRKETIKNLNNFLKTEESHLFKGRLQLDKKEANIYVILKNEIIGMISSNQLMEAFA
jgi:hypothetical protein